MKLSEAIRIGCKKIRGQARGTYFRFIGGKCSAACALGAAFVGAGNTPVRNEHQVSDTLQGLFPALKKGQRLAGCDCESVCLHMCVVTANDDRRWSRERIASLLEEMGC